MAPTACARETDGLVPELLAQDALVEAVARIEQQVHLDRVVHVDVDRADGAHFVMGRIPIGASDYALQRYTDDETANDTSLASFSISRDMMYLIPYVKAAQAVNGSIRFWASPTKATSASTANAHASAFLLQLGFISWSS